MKPYIIILLLLSYLPALYYAKDYGYNIREVEVAQSNEEHKAVLEKLQNLINENANEYIAEKNEDDIRIYNLIQERDIVSASCRRTLKQRLTLVELWNDAIAVKGLKPSKESPYILSGGNTFEAACITIAVKESNRLKLLHNKGL